MTSDKNTQKGLYIKNFGCQMNVYDGDRMQEMMSSHNMGLLIQLKMQIWLF